MTQLSTKIKLYANQQVDFTKDVILQDDSNGQGAYIKEWNLPIAKPTDAQLDALEAQATAYEAEQLILAKRKAEYPNMADYLDGIVKGDTAQVQKYIDDCLAVKAKYPKENN